MWLATFVRLHSPHPALSFALAFCALVSAPVAAFAAALPEPQDTSAATATKQAYDKVIGVVTSISADGKTMSVKPDTGAPSDVVLDAATSYMLVPPGEKDLRKATRIDLKDIKSGDRVYARSKKVDGQEHAPAVSVFVMSQAEVAQHQAKTRDEWQRRGAAGKVTAVDPTAKTITVSVQASGGAKNLTIQTDDKTSFRRYAPDSVRFADAKPSDFTSIAVGNNVRVLGDKTADGSSIHAEELVSGSFRNFGSTVISVDAANNEVKVNDLQTKKPVIVKVNDDTNLRKLPPQMAMMLAHLNSPTPGTGPAAGGTGPAGAHGGQAKGEGGPDSHPGFNGPANPSSGSGGAPGASSGSAQGSAPGGGDAGRGGFGQRTFNGSGRPDINQMLERAPKMTLADLKPGDALMISSTNSADASKVTAITVVAGVEPLLAASPSAASGQSGLSGSMTLDIGLPQ